MKTLAEVRSQYPGYDSKSDAELASALHKKFYSEIPEKDFYAFLYHKTFRRRDRSWVEHKP